jgi:hypothetical protein
MSQEQKEKFEQSLQAAIKTSLNASAASAAVRERLLQSLAAQKTQTASTLPAGLREERLAEFEDSLARAVSRSQQWAAPDQTAARVEAAVSEQAGVDLRSERSLHLADPSESDKARYLSALRGAICTSQQSVQAPSACRHRIEQALREATRSASDPQSSKSQASPAAPAFPKVVPLPTPARRPLWKRALVATASLAAGFAFLMGSLIGGADQALAETVRADHQRCCSALSGTEMKRCASYDSKLYGPLPEPPISSEWVRVASRMCHGGKGEPMIHNVYLREDGKAVSIHFLPPAEETPKADSSAPQEIAGGSFPVMAWQSGGWTVTACSSDLDSGSLALLLNDCVEATPD